MRAYPGLRILHDESMSKKENKDNVVTGLKQEKIRDKNGRFLKGKSGNPRGRPKTDEEFKEALTKLVPRAIEVLHEILMKEDAADRDKLKAVELIFDRIYGRPFQSVKLDEVDTTIHIVDDDPEGAEYNG